MLDSAVAPAKSPLSADELRRIHAYWRAANYLSVGHIYLLDNPLLREPFGQRRERGGDPRWPPSRHDDGLQPIGRHDDGNAAG